MFLRYRVRARTRELELANRKLDHDIKRRKEVEKRLQDERNRSVFYLDLLIHDMGNINQGLLNSTQIYNIIKHDQKKADNVIDTLSQLVNRSVNLVKNVHKFAEATTSPLDSKPIDLAPLIKKALTSVILSFPEEEITYEMKAPPKKILVPAEPLLEEVFYNIFHNAVKYHELGQPKIDIEIKRLASRDRVQIEIADRGRGVPDHMKEAIFSRPKKAEEAKHLGMGLSLVKVLLDRYGGTIEVKDRKEGDHRYGSRFIITLPILEETSDETETYRRTVDPSIEHKEIIIG
jgi:K+-sensing histidine kinase KdpD